jgi:hypothetical protein
VRLCGTDTVPPDATVELVEMGSLPSVVYRIVALVSGDVIVTLKVS